MTSAVEPIEVRRYGTFGPVVAVLHGGPGAPGSVAGLAAPLGDELRVLEPMQRHADGREPMTMKRHVDDLAAVLDEPVLLVGWSWGAMLGLSFTVEHPELVRALVLVGCGTYDDATRAEYQRRFPDALGEDGRREMAALREQIAAATTRDEHDRLLAARGRRAESAGAFALVEADDEPSPAVDSVGHAETWADVVRLQADGTEPASFAAITVPVLMLHGEVDPHPGPGTRDRLRTHVPQLEYVELPRCGHTPWKERHARADFFSTLRAWLHTHA